jgi:uncharacterized protein
MKSLRPFLLMLALLIAGLAQPVLAQSFPKLTGRVVDDAHLLSPEQQAGLETKLAQLEQQSGRQLVVATIPDLQDYDISDYAYRLGRAWGIGDKEKNDGALLVVAPNERRVFIATGYGVEGIVTDALSSQIIRNQITPLFKAGNYPGGIDAGVNALSELLTLPPEEARARAAQADAAERNRKKDDPNIIGAVIVLLFVFFFVVLPLMRATRGGKYGGGRGSGIPPIILWGPGLGGGRDDDDDHWGGFGGGGGWGGGGGGGGGFSGGGGSFGGGGAGGSW